MVSIAQNKTNRDEIKIRRNAIYYEIFGNGFWHSLNYDRYLQFSKKSGIVLRGGISYYEKIFPLAEVNFLTGKNKHHFETGLGYTVFHEGNVVFMRSGYRFHGNKGLLIRVAPMYCFTEQFIWFGVSFGYCF